ncbi:hypothetical protein Tco_0975467 [Tanacetum coccineum]|uniref:Uncharacterized protein n=1 Tax=Tanacetum coccineum TaxID=301880 RepID=A0ABQ5EEJ0_9ASTR
MQETKAQGVTQDKLELLKDVSGCFRPGVLTAGKTTLMDVLAGQKIGGYTEGRISISEYPKKQETCSHSKLTFIPRMSPSQNPCNILHGYGYILKLILQPESDVELTPLSEALVGLPGVNRLSTEQRKIDTTTSPLCCLPTLLESVIYIKKKVSSSQGPIPTALKNFSMSQKDKALQEFVQDQWLCDTANDIVRVYAGHLVPDINTSGRQSGHQSGCRTGIRRRNASSDIPGKRHDTIEDNAGKGKTPHQLVRGHPRNN